MTILFSTLLITLLWSLKKIIKSVPFTALHDGLACFCSSHSVLSPFRPSVGCLDGEEDLIQYHILFSDTPQAREGPTRELSPREAPASGWAALGLSYKVQWPLHILFTPAVLEK